MRFRVDSGNSGNHSWSVCCCGSKISKLGLRTQTSCSSVPISQGSDFDTAAGLANSPDVTPCAMFASDLSTFRLVKLPVRRLGLAIAVAIFSLLMLRCLEMTTEAMIIIFSSNSNAQRDKAVVSIRLWSAKQK